MMKKLLLLALLAIGMTANAETIIAGDGESEDESLLDLGQGKDQNDRWTMHFNLGVNVPTGAPDGVKFAPFRSWEVGWTVGQYDYTPKNWSTTFSVGLGLEWDNYTLKGHDDMFAKVNDKVVIGNAYGGNIEDLSSRVHVLALTMPLLIKQRLAKNFAITVGAQLNWNYYSRLTNKYKDGDDECNISTKDIGTRPITVDLLGMVHINRVAVYCKYAPMSALKSDRGPEFQSLSFGIRL